ncbi:microtubule-associated protein 6 homolog isoform X1 [Eucyclogobius newberryi]|uniref:microtubule-associated protein 6 homolog isoform X1 n=1 Tax=Eucyclogobius newberryi TaxID=166745 RepID=UPI003B59F1CC
MAWPCITRACCINRFWSELDKGDIAVPLVFTKYSDVAGVQRVAHHPQPRPTRAAAIAIETQPYPGEQTAKAPPAKDGSSASVMRQDFKAWKVRPEPSCKPRDQYHPSAAPFTTETQYQKDYKPWPIPKKHDHPWIPKAEEAESGPEKSELEEKVHEKETKGTTRGASEERKVVNKSERQVCAEVSAEQRKGRAAADALNRHIKEVMTTSSSYRSEFKAYKDVKPTKPIKAPSQYKPPGEETNLETSYSSTYKGEQVKAHPTDNKQQDRRRIRSLYSEPSKVDKPAPRAKPRKTPTTTTGKMVKKAKEKQLSSTLSSKKKPGTAESKPEGVVTKKSKELSNRRAEAKH